MVANSDVGVFRHAATERGGGGGLWMGEVQGQIRPCRPL